MKEEFNTRLKEAMDMRGINAATLSKKAGIKPPMISDYLSGKYKAKQDKVYSLAKALDINEKWLMGFDEDIERISDKGRNNTDNQLLNKINKLSNNQKKAIINIIDNMR